MDIILTKYDFPCGRLIIGSYDEQLCLCSYADSNNHPHNLVVNRLRRLLKTNLTWGDSPINEKTILQLDEYFSGSRTTFDIPLLYPGTEFQRRSWEALIRIPYGTTLSYAQQATNVGNPKAVRAVASANHANAIAIIIPCHRVIGSNNTLTGYAGGLDIKRYLLDLEKRNI